MDILLDSAIVHGGEVVVDNMQNIADIDTTGRDTGGDQNGGSSGSEGPHRGLTLALGPIGVHGRAGKVHVEQEVIEFISSALAVDENDGTARQHGRQQIHQTLALVLLNKDNVLLDIAVRASSTSDTESDIISRKIVLGQVAKGLRESGREQKILDLIIILVCKSRLVSIGICRGTMMGKTDSSQP